MPWSSPTPTSAPPRTPHSRNCGISWPGLNVPWPTAPTSQATPRATWKSGALVLAVHCQPALPYYIDYQLHHVRIHNPSSTRLLRLNRLNASAFDVPSGLPRALGTSQPLEPAYIIAAQPADCKQQPDYSSNPHFVYHVQALFPSVVLSTGHRSHWFRVACNIHNIRNIHYGRT